MTEQRQKRQLRRSTVGSLFESHEASHGSLSSQEARIQLRSFNRSLPMALLRTREAVMQQFRPSLRRHGITEQQWRVLRALSAIKEIEILALAETTFLLPPSLSRILRDLEERKLIVRRSPQADRRRSLISIASKGIALLERAGVNSELIYSEISKRFGARKMRELHELLSELELQLANTGPLDPDSEFD